MATHLKRFWDKVSIKQDENGYKILLDERPVKLPKKNILYVQNQEMAKRVVVEWESAGQEKGDSFSFDNLPITRIIGTMIEKISPDREVYIDVLLPYFNGDLLCYHAEHPHKLVKRQKEEWMPVITWFEERFNCRLSIQHGIMPIAQTVENIEKIKKYLEDLNDNLLTAFSILIPALGSIILTIALLEKYITAEQAFELAFLDEQVQAEMWGQDTEQDKRLKKVKQDIKEAFEFMELVS